MVQQKKVPNSGDIPNGTGRRESSMSFQRKDITDARVQSNNATKSDAKATNGMNPNQDIHASPCLNAHHYWLFWPAFVPLFPPSATLVMVMSHAKHVLLKHC
jgi:hypothetical protein